MSVSERISPALGRLVIAWFFLSEAWWRLNNWDGTLALLQSQHIAQPVPVLAVAIFIMFLGGLSILLGFHARAGALLLFAFMAAVSYCVYDYWNVPEQHARDATYDLFVRNVAIAGALLFIVGMGPGRFALDNSGGR